MRHPFGSGYNRVPLIRRPGVIAILSGDRTTFPAFAASVALTRTVKGSALVWQQCRGGLRHP
jgi:hypothetical protein